MSKSVKKEKEDFHELYDGIDNEVLKARIQSTGEWYIDSAFRYKWIFYILSAVGIIIPILVTVANGMTLSEKCTVVVKNTTIIFSAVTALSTAFLSFTKCREKWTLYRTAIEKMKNALVLYWAGKIQDPELRELIQKLETLMEEEHAEWLKISRKSDETADEKIDDFDSK